MLIFLKSPPLPNRSKREVAQFQASNKDSRLYLKYEEQIPSSEIIQGPIGFCGVQTIPKAGQSGGSPRPEIISLH